MSLLGEIRRRKVFQVAAVYAVVAWLIIQVIDVVSDPLNLPDWLATIVIVLLAVGFPIAVILAWAFELTPEGVVRDQGTSVASQSSGRAIEFVLIALLVVAVGTLLDREFSPSGSSPDVAGILPDSVAVLPFANVSPNPDDAYFAVGLHEEILNQLAKLSQLNVVARTSVLQYAGAQRPIAEIARELNVETIMEGSVRYAGDRIRVTTQLIDAASGTHLWSETYDRDFEDIFEIESNIAMNVANAMAVEFSLEEQRAIERAPTDSPEAYALLLQARSVFLADSAESLRLVNQALAIDPEFAAAHAAKASYYAGSVVAVSGRNAVNRSEQQAAIELSRQHARRATELDPSLSSPLLVIAQLDSYAWRWSDALTTFEQTGSSAQSIVVWLMSYRGEHDEAIARMRMRVRNSPDNSATHWNLANVLAYAGETAEARQVQRNAIALAPTIPVYHIWMAYIELSLGNEAEALPEIRLAEQLLGDIRTVASLGELAYLYSRVGLREDAMRIVDEIEQIAVDLDIGSGIRTMALLAIGDRAGALAELQAAAEKVANHEIDQSFYNLMNLKMNITADPLLEQPEFVALRDRLRGD